MYRTSFGYVYVKGTHNGGYGVFNLSKVKGGGLRVIEL